MKKRINSNKQDVSGMLLSDFINKYYFPAIEGELKTKSLITKRRLIDTHILNIKSKPIASFKGMKLRDITADAIVTWQKAKQKEGYSDGYLLSMRKGKMEFIGTNAWFFMIVNILKLSYFYLVYE